MKRAGVPGLESRTKLQKIAAEAESEEENWAASHWPLSGDSRGLPGAEEISDTDSGLTVGGCHPTSKGCG